MTTSRLAAFALVLLGSAALETHALAQSTIITQWNYNNDPVAQNSSPASSTGTGTDSSLGMTTNYNNTTPAPLDSSDVLAGTGSSDPNTTNNIWRIRGGDGTNAPAKGAPNGWSSNAPIGTQGAQFLASTAGFTNIQVQFDWSSTTQGEANLQVQYTTDGTTYTNVPAGMYTAALGGATLKTNTTSANTVIGAYLQATTTTQTFSNQITINLSGITAANNDAAFGIRLVNASTGADDVSTTSVIAGTPTMINNTSGNWRFDEVTISSVPEPSTYALMFVGAAGIFAVIRRTRRVAA